MQEINYTIRGNRNRRKIRKRVVKKFLKEKSGTGTGAEASKYIYYVEKLKNGNRVYLSRPARLKYGFDFRISVEETLFPNNRDYPSFEHLDNDLIAKRNENTVKYNLLIAAIHKVHQCKDVNKIIRKLNISFNTGYSCEMILKLYKWLFIEQDIRYWNYSGRDKLMNGIDNL